jgi:hypothetical protein
MPSLDQSIVWAVGGLLFRLLRLFRALDKLAISLRDVVAADVGSLIVVATPGSGGLLRTRREAERTLPALQRCGHAHV